MRFSISWRVIQRTSRELRISGLLFPAAYAAPMALRCWKHSRQNTGRPWVGRKGTVVSLPHCEQLVFVSERICNPPATPGLFPCARLALHALHRFGSFLNPLSEKNICSPAVNTNSALQSAHFSTLSWYSIRCSGTVLRQGRAQTGLAAQQIAASNKKTGREHNSSQPLGWHNAVLDNFGWSVA